MEFTFGIITNKGKTVQRVIDSIFDLNIPKDKFEIIIVGECNITPSDNIIKIPFDETLKQKPWITKKKNLVTLSATKENIVYLHDYVSFEKDWYTNFLEYGNDWDICLNPIKNPNGSRFRDWHLCYTDYDNFKIPNKSLLLPYDDDLSTDFMYINGTYWIAKKWVMEKFPLDEKQLWGECEDIIWSKITKYSGIRYSMNKKSICRLLKHKNTIFTEMDINFYNNIWKPFILNKERSNKMHQHYYNYSVNHGSLYQRWMNENQAKMYIEDRKN